MIFKDEADIQGRLDPEHQRDRCLQRDTKYLSAYIFRALSAPVPVHLPQSDSLDDKEVRAQQQRRHRNESRMTLFDSRPFQLNSSNNSLSWSRQSERRAGRSR